MKKMISNFKLKMSKENILNYGLALFFFILPFQTRWIFSELTIGGSTFQYGIGSLYITQILLIVIMAAVIKLKWNKLYRTPIVRGLIVVWIAAIFSLFFAINKSLAAISVLQLVFTMLLFVMLLDKRVRLRFIMQAFVAGLILPVALGAYQFFIGHSGASTFFGLAERSAEALGDAVLVVNGERVLRAYGTFSHPNIFGGYLAIGLVAVFSLMQGVKKESEKVLTSFAGIVLAFGLVLTFSRSAWVGLVIAFILGAIILVVKDPKRAKKIAFSSSVVMIALAFFATMFSSIIVTRFTGEDPVEMRAVTERIEQYRDYPAVVGLGWLAGYGAGNYTMAIHETFPDREWWEYQPIHNVPLLVLSEIGIIGALAFIFWAGSNDVINFRRFPNIDAVSAFMMGNVLLTILFLDHYVWTSWSGLSLGILVMALTARWGED